ncbi:hypothetical protein BHO_0900025 (plasmid) [Borrelia hermsii YBT]|nr:hypothetical protein BHO_0900025 [Borrelia hermsii YBT]
MKTNKPKRKIIFFLVALICNEFYPEVLVISFLIKKEEKNIFSSFLIIIFKCIL